MSLNIMDSQSIARFTKLVGRWVFQSKELDSWRWCWSDVICKWNSGSFRCFSLTIFHTIYFCGGPRFVEGSRIDWSNLTEIAPAPLERIPAGKPAQHLPICFSIAACYDGSCKRQRFLETGFVMEQRTPSLKKVYLVEHLKKYISRINQFKVFWISATHWTFGDVSSWNTWWWLALEKVNSSENMSQTRLTRSLCLCWWYNT